MHHGQEIYCFFNIYGNKGFIGIIISITLIGLIIYKTFKIMIKNNINTYGEFTDKIIPSKLSNNKLVKFTINNIINIFLLISFYIMATGFATYFSQEINVLAIYGGITISILTYLTFRKNIYGIIKINEYLIPILIILIILLGIKKIDTVQINNIYNYSGHFSWFLNSILYASYNSIVLIPILIGLKQYILNKKEAKILSCIVSSILLILTCILFFLISIYIIEIKNIEIPITYIASSISSIYKYIYGLVILVAIFTSAIAAGYGFLNNCINNKKAYKYISFVICFISIFVSYLSFSSLVNILYPIFGYLGLLQIIFLLKP